MPTPFSGGCACGAIRYRCIVLAKSTGLPMMGIYPGSLDDPSWHRPTMDVWTASAQPWDHMDPGLQKFPKGLT